MWCSGFCGVSWAPAISPYSTGQPLLCGGFSTTPHLNKQDSCKPHLCSAASLKLLAASQAKVQLQQPPQTHIPPELSSLLRAGKLKFTQKHFLVSLFADRVTPSCM